MTDTLDDMGRRKADHIALCLEEGVEYRSTRTLLDDVRLHHDSLPELDAEAVDPHTTLAGIPLRAPLMISGMTGGVDEAGTINRSLARVAQARGMAFGVGSQRPMLSDRATLSSYRVRDVAPDVTLFGNIGAVQAASMTSDALRELVRAIEADALCIHLNPAQEMIQPEGDRDFSGCLDGIRRALDVLDVPVIAKETGSGMSPRTVARLAEAGVTAVDVSGAGGTTWVGVETLRSGEHTRAVGEALWEWGIPTAASVVFGVRAGLDVVASGGIRDGLDAARALALGASVASAALPFLRAAAAGGEQAAGEVADNMLRTIATVLVLTGSPNLAALRDAPRTIGAGLREWID